MEKINLLILGVLLVVTITAGILSNTNTSISLSEEHKQILRTVGKGIGDNIEHCYMNETEEICYDTNLEVSESICEGTKCKITLYQEDGINKEIKFSYNECLEWSECKTELCNPKCLEEITDSEILEIRDKAIKSTLENIARIQIQRDNKETNDAKFGGGIVSIE